MAYNRLVFRVHAIQRMFERRITEDDVGHVLATGEVIERYRGDVPFSLDSDGRSVWVMALFGKGAPPRLRTVSDTEVSWIPLDDEQEDDRNEEEGEH